MVAFYLWSLLIMPIIWIIMPLAKFAWIQVILPEGADNVDLRTQMRSEGLAKKDTNGRIRRLMAAHENTMEAMVVWYCAVFTALLQGVSPDEIDIYAKVCCVDGLHQRESSLPFGLCLGINSAASLFQVSGIHCGILKHHGFVGHSHHSGARIMMTFPWSKKNWDLPSIKLILFTPSKGLCKRSHK
ncbi:unnamed protein product [Chrysoparadoxa australica]